MSRETALNRLLGDDVPTCGQESVERGDPHHPCVCGCMAGHVGRHYCACGFHWRPAHTDGAS